MFFSLTSEKQVNNFNVSKATRHDLEKNEKNGLNLPQERKTKICMKVKDNRNQSSRGVSEKSDNSTSVGSPVFWFTSWPSGSWFESCNNYMFKLYEFW